VELGGGRGSRSAGQQGPAMAHSKKSKTGLHTAIVVLQGPGWDTGGREGAARPNKVEL
jgi:hypothetical protein